MGVHRLLTKEAREVVKDKLRDCQELTKSEMMDIVRPYCSFDDKLLREQALGRLVGSLCRSIRDESGIRTVFIAKGQDAIVNIDTSTSLDLVAAVDEQIGANIRGLIASKQKTERRRQELSGQTNLFESEQ